MNSTEKTERIFGIRAVLEALKADRQFDKVYCQREIKGALAKELFESLKKHKVPYQFVPVEKLNRLSKFQNHQGVVAQVSLIDYQDLEEALNKLMSEKSDPLILLLDQISDVRNMGAILRTAACTKVDLVILPQHGSAPVNADAIKTSAGGAFQLTLCKTTHSLDAVFLLKGMGVKIVSVTEKTKNVLFDQDLKGPMALVLGSEDKGISTSVLKNSDVKAQLPLLGDIDSLNVSVACGVALYETLRQRR